MKKGDILLIKPGTCVPVDGVVVKGSSSVDESMLSGESVPSIKQESSKVYTGSMNQEGSLEIVAEKFGEETALGKNDCSCGRSCKLKSSSAEDG